MRREVQLKRVFIFLFLAAALPLSGYAARNYDLVATGDHSVWAIVNDAKGQFEKDSGISLDLIPEIAIVGKGCAKGFMHTLKGEPDRDFGLVCCNFGRDFLEKKGLKVYPFAREPLAILVNKKNPVAGLSLSQVRGIFSGKIRNWAEVGGNNEKIVVVTQLHCKDYRPNWKGIFDSADKFTKKRLEVTTQPEMAQTVADFKEAIGHLEMASVVEAGGHKNIKVLKIDGFAPTSGSLERPDYPLYGTLSVVTKGEAKGKILRFIEYMRQNPHVSTLMKRYGMIQAR